jgi:hypothetical protein
VETIQNDPRVAPAPSQAGAKVSTAPLAIEDAPKKPPKVRGNPNRATPYDKIALSDKGMEQKDDKTILKNLFRTPEGVINMPREVFEKTDFGSKTRTLKEQIPSHPRWKRQESKTRAKTKTQHRGNTGHHSIERQGYC